MGENIECFEGFALSFTLGSKSMPTIELLILFLFYFICRPFAKSQLLCNDLTSRLKISIEIKVFYARSLSPALHLPPRCLFGGNELKSAHKNNSSFNSNHQIRRFIPLYLSIQGRNTFNNFLMYLSC